MLKYFALATPFLLLSWRPQRLLGQCQAYIHFVPFLMLTLTRRGGNLPPDRLPPPPLELPPPRLLCWLKLLLLVLVIWEEFGFFAEVGVLSLGSNPIEVGVLE